MAGSQAEPLQKSNKGSMEQWIEREQKQGQREEARASWAMSTKWKN